MPGLSGPFPRTPDDLAAVRRIDEIAFQMEHAPAAWERHQALYAEMPGYVVRDGDLVVGHAGHFAFRMAVPGAGVQPVAGVTAVSVLPTHRRQGVLRSLMRRQLEDLHAAGTGAAALWASESGIYGRFGYGQASRKARTTVPRGARSLRPVPSDDAVRVELLELADALGACDEAYGRAVPLRPGMVERSPAMLAYVAADDPGERGGATRQRCALARDAESGEVRGYGWFAQRSEWGPYGADGATAVRELVALDAAATAALLRFLLDLDLTSRTDVWSLPVDSPLFTLLEEPRRSAPIVGDQLWVRLVDVGVALGQRAYGLPVDVRVEVRDETCPWNSGTWSLAGDERGASCERTSGPADLALDVRELGAAFLGDPALGAAVQAGLVEERTPGTADRLARAMAWSPLPWIAFVF